MNKKTKASLKIRDSKGDLYLICPIIEKINKLMFNEGNKIDLDDMFSIQRHFDEIKEIAKVLQKELGYNDCPNQSDFSYKYSTVLKLFRQEIKNNNLTEGRFNEILETYLWKTKTKIWQ